MCKMTTNRWRNGNDRGTEKPTNDNRRRILFLDWIVFVKELGYRCPMITLSYAKRLHEYGTFTRRKTTVCPDFVRVRVTKMWRNFRDNSSETLPKLHVEETLPPCGRPTFRNGDAGTLSSAFPIRTKGNDGPFPREL